MSKYTINAGTRNGSSSDSESRKMPEQFANVSTVGDSDLCVHQRFERQVLDSPNALAAICEDESLTYRDLNRMANQLARHLRAIGVGPEVLVGLFVERGIDMLVAMLAVLKSGGAYVPIDPKYPASRIIYILEECRAPILLTQEKILGRLPHTNATVLCLDRDSASWERQAGDDLEHQGHAGNLAYVIYTSGSTGWPKGVMIEHGSLSAHIAAIQSKYELDGTDCVFQFASMSFDVAVEDIFWTLSVGARLIIRSDRTPLEPVAFIENLERWGVTKINLPTAYWQQLTVDLAARSMPMPPCLELVMIAGESVRTQNVAIWQEHWGDGPKLVNAYGPTEATIIVTSFDIPPGWQPEGPIPIGTALPGVRAYILNSDGEPLPPGEAGELHLGGNHVGRGYLNQPALSAERFVADPFVGGPNGRMYKTGDIARWRPDGNIEYLGRLDSQVKIRGYRIELGEIENHLAKHPDVRNVALQVREDVEGDKRLVAYAVATDSRRLDADGLRDHLLSLVPEYMVPSVFVELDTLPLTTSGKIDHAALPAPTYRDQLNTYLAPTTSTDKILLKLASEILGLEWLGMADHFVNVGGHSLLAIQLVSRVHTELGVRLPVADVFEFPVLGDLARHIDTLERSPVDSDSSSIPVAARDQHLPTSFAQQRLWFVDQFETQVTGRPSTKHCLPHAMELRGPLDVDCLHRALQALVDRHETLRTHIVNHQSQPVQEIAPSRVLPFPRADCLRLPEPDREEYVRRHIRTNAETGFHLDEDFLFRVELIQRGDNTYVLLFNMHHIIADAWSLDVFFYELGILYDAYLAGQSNPLPPLQFQYADFASWQRRHETPERLTHQLHYWQRKLADLPVLSLPTDRPRPEVQTFAGATYRFELSEELTASLKALSRRQETTLFMTLGAAFAVLLGKYARQDDVVYGVPAANRTRQEVESLIGFFVNPWVLRTHIDAKTTFTDLLAQFKKTCLEAYDNQDIPFEHIVRALNPKRHLSYNPLFQVMFQLFSDLRNDLKMTGLNVVPLDHGNQQAQFDLSLDMEDRDELITGVFEYNTEQFDAATIECMAQHFETLLSGVVRRPATSLGDLTLLDTSERERLRKLSNPALADGRVEACVHELFERQVALSPDAVALVFEERFLTYRELNEQANRLARHLLSMGAGPEILVGLLLSRGLEMVVAMLAVLKSGSAYVPLDPKYPASRIHYMLEDSRTTILITQEEFRAGLPTAPANVLCLDREEAPWNEHASSNLEEPTEPKDLAYVVYTSGTTGMPKGVMVEKGSLGSHILSIVKEYGLGDSDRVFQFASTSFDVAGEEIYSALVAGARLHIRSEQMSLDPANLLRKLEEWQITKVDLPTAYWHHLTAAIDDLALPIPSRLRLVLIGGEAVRPQSVVAWQKHWGDSPELVNAYGPTEATITSTIFLIPCDWRPRTTVPIGTPIPGTQAYILDSDGSPTPLGLVGELYLAGAQVARGYINNPELTNERFVHGSFGDGAASRMYKTGDLARWLPDGAIEFLGRLDTQTKIRGFRVELGEIENCLVQHPEVLEAVVRVREDSSRVQTLVAYLVPLSSQSFDPRALRTYLQSFLPDHMVPSAYVCLEDLPVKASGKIDVEALPLPSYQSSRNTIIAPDTPNEKALSALFTDVLKLDSVSATDDFFELGGHSLLVLELIARVRATLRVELSLLDVFDKPVLRDLAAHISGLLAADRHGNDGSIPALPRGEPLAASFAQERLWFIDQLETQSSGKASRVYLIPVAFRMDGPLDVDCLRRAMQTIVDRHETLRTALFNRDGQTIQLIEPSVRAPLSLVDLSGLSEAEQRASVREQVQRHAEEGFHLDGGRLCRARLLQLRSDRHVFLVNMHHIITDEWSMGVFLRELSILYTSYSANQPNPLQPLAIQYADYSGWQRSEEHGKVLTHQLEYWRGQLRDLPDLLLPTDRPRPDVETFAGATYRMTISRELTKNLKDLSHEYDATLFMTLGAAFAVLLGRHANQRDVVFGVPVANRTRPEVLDLIGFFVNSLVVRTHLDPELTFSDLLGEFKQTCLDAFSNQDVPFEHIVSSLNPTRSPSHNPMFQCMFQLLIDPADELSLPGLKVQSLEHENHVSQFDLSLDISEKDGQLVAAYEYNTDLFDKDTIERWAQHYVNLLKGVLAAPDTSVFAHPMLDETERRLLVTEFNDAPGTFRVELCVHEIFEFQADRSPDSVALVFEEQSLTYRELNQQANCLARHLGKLGVEPGALVALFFERDPYAVVAMLAVLKSGGAYVPIDPKYPIDRIRFMVDDCQPLVTLTQERHLGLLGMTADTAVCVERDKEKWMRYSHENLGKADLDGLAYVLYTSGSTGVPKGVMVEQRSLSSYISAYVSRFELNETDRVFQFANFSFDVAGEEIYSALITGSRLMLRSDRQSLEPAALLGKLTEWGVTKMDLPTAYWHQFTVDLASQSLPMPPSLRLMITGGEAVRHECVATWFEHWGDEVTLVNLYGPTETTMGVTSYEFPKDWDSTGPMPIGVPFANSRAYVLDTRGQIAPLGVAGELYIGGSQVARGYLNQAELTEQCFIPDPHDKENNGRLYKTGDLARWLPDGNLEFLGRTDSQVKIRGFRIELGEIETRLASHPAIREVAVTAGEDPSGARRLVAYVSPKKDQGHTDSSNQVALWKTLHNHIYADLPSDRDAEFRDWESSYDGKPIPRVEMEAWRDATVSRILALQPRRVLEIGVGTGVLLRDIAPHCEKYHGMDFSENAIEYIKREIGDGVWYSDRVSLSVKDADDLSEMPAGAFDVVVINSVVQYFPNTDYLARVLAQASRLLEPGGVIFVGDVRSYPLHRQFRTAIQVSKDPLAADIAQLRLAVSHDLLTEAELLLAPEFFVAFAVQEPLLKGSDIRIRSESPHNELTRYRYDVILRTKNDSLTSLADVSTLQWGKQIDGIEALRQHLLAKRPKCIRVSTIPNKRLSAEATVLRGAGNGLSPERLRAVLASDGESTAVDPVAIVHLGEKTGYEVVVTWSRGGRDGNLDAIFTEMPLAENSAPIDTYLPDTSCLRQPRDQANVPSSGQDLGNLAKELRRFLEEQVPDYMIPSSFVVLDALPLNTRGKVDYDALPVPEPPAEERRFIAPRSDTEKIVARIVADLLGIDRVGLSDSFFDLGGHSLLATQLISRIRKQFKLELTLHDLFSFPVLGQLANHISDQESTEGESLLPVVSRGRPLPASFAQERLWFIDQLETENTGKPSNVYLMPDALGLVGELDIDALRRALELIVDRHETLRTSIISVDGRAMQWIQQPGDFSLPLTDMSGLSESEKQDALQERFHDFANTGFVLDQEALFRAELVRLEANHHVLMFNMHHIISDGWSTGVFISELCALYTAFVQQEPNPLPTLPVQYADYAAWQRSETQEKIYEQQLEYWRNQLSDLPSLSLPTDRPRPAEETFVGAHHKMALSPGLTARIKQLSQVQEATVFMTLGAAFTALLGRYTNQHDIVFGVPIANRTQDDLEGLIGFFVNSLVLRTRLDDAPTFIELLRRFKRKCIQAYANQDIPFERIVSELNPSRSLSRNPLYQVMFQLLTDPYENLNMPGLSVEPLDMEDDASQFDLCLDMAEEDGVLTGVFEYNTDLFDESTIVRFSKHYQRLLEAIVDCPQSSILDLEILEETERLQVVSASFGEENSSKAALRITELFEQQVAASPNAKALVFEDRTLTYGELNKRANQLAHYLIAMGIVPDDLVGLYYGRGVDMIIGMLASLKSGGAYVPMDPAYPKNRIQGMIEDSSAKVVLTEERLLSQLQPLSVEVVSTDRERGPWSGLSRRNPEQTAGPNNLAYVLYTSGSTGKPKGVLIEHQSLSNYITSYTSRFGFNEQDCVYQFSSFGFDAAGEEIFSALIAGSRLIVRSEHDSLEPAVLLKNMDDWGVTKMDLPTAYWHQLTSEADASSLQFPENLRLLVTGGDALRKESVATWQKLRNDHIALVNLYGPSETTMGTTAYVFPQDWDATGPLPIGVPFANTQVYVLDSRGRLAPTGVAGELYVGGVQVGRGYLNQPELTANCFIPNQIENAPGERLYKTGDMGRRLPDGNLEFLGRTDSQVKIRGFRIELGEIESHLALHPQVREVAVLAREELPGERRLVAYVAPHRHLLSEDENLQTEEHLSLWKKLHDDTYDGLTTDRYSQFFGWNSSYDDKPIPISEMMEWRDVTVSRILALRPRNVLEIGVGTGLLMREIAPHCETYHGTDFSKKVIAYLKKMLETAPEISGRVYLHHCDADSLPSQDMGSFDVVVLNSVVQYFPNAEYLVSVLKQALKLLQPGGVVFVGDVRNLKLHRQLRTAIQVVKMPATTSVHELRWQVDQDLLSETELLLDPGFFEAFSAQNSRVAGVDIRVRRGRYRNELTGYRYDVFLRTNQESTLDLTDIPVVKWEDEYKDEGLDKIRRLIEGKRGVCLRMTGVPNARLAAECAVMRGIQDAVSVSDLKRILDSCDVSNLLAPDDFQHLGKQRNFRVLITWSNSGVHESLDVIFIDSLHAKEEEFVGTYVSYGEEWREPVYYANVPGSKENLGKLVKNLRNYLGGNLPDHMLPSAYVVLTSLPITPNGKVDRKSLPSPKSHVAKNDYMEPKTLVEKELASIISGLLAIEMVGMNDNFFELGGHSLLATQFVSKVKQALQVELSVRDIFSTANISELATRIETRSANGIDRCCESIEYGDNEDYVALVPIQKGNSDSPVIFCLPGAGATVACFAALASSLSADVSVYGLQPKGLDGSLAPHTTVESMANAYADAIGSCTEESVHIIGHSFGALVAFELARVFQERDRPMNTLILLDPAALRKPDEVFRTHSRIEALLQLAGTFEDSNDCSFGLSAMSLSELTPTEQISALRERLIDAKIISPQAPVSAIKGMVEVFESNINANYSPKHGLDHPVVLIRAVEEPDAANVADCWYDVAPRLFVRSTPGGHMSMLAEPHVWMVARHLEEIWKLPSEYNTRILCEGGCR